MMFSVNTGNRNGQKSISKPLCMLAIFDAIENKELLLHKILFPNEYIIKRFGLLYEQTYKNQKGFGVSFFIRPFFHLVSSEFYHLIWKKDVVPPSMSATPSAKYLREHLQYAKLDDGLWELLQDSDNRDYFRRNIINRYLLK